MNDDANPSVPAQQVSHIEWLTNVVKRYNEWANEHNYSKWERVVRIPPEIFKGALREQASHIDRDTTEFMFLGVTVRSDPDMRVLLDRIETAFDYRKVQVAS